jgi:hypothetical protein
MTKYKKNYHFHQIQSILTLWQKIDFLFIFSHKIVFKFLVAYFLCQICQKNENFLGFLI